MNPIDEAILEGLLENRIYSIESSRFLVDRVHPRSCWTDLKFAEMWTVVQHLRRCFGLSGFWNVRSRWAASMEPHTELNHFAVSACCEQYLQYELQKNMTE